MPRRLAILLVLGLLLAACGDDGDAPVPADGPTYPFATVLLDNGEETTLVTVEVAETPEQRERGLTGRESLPQDEGMVFVFFEQQETGFSMKDTRIPLSVAYFDATGTIVGIVDAAPCTNDVCKLDDPDTPYAGALAVNQGAFEGAGIEEGDVVRLTR